MPWPIYLACNEGDRINTEIYLKLHEEIDLAGLYDILEMKQVLSSWKDAEVASQIASRHT